ncbi:MAG: hypothetical protein JOY54_21075 [Acidobacteriaceae bacterium]|nr:hypothetical protein [Acidobacteriaceae bacterium]
MPEWAVPDDQSESNFRNLLVEKFPKLEENVNANKENFQLTNKAELVNDYARIGSFLTNKATVLEGLKKLETALRSKLNTLAGNGGTNKYTQLKDNIENKRFNLRSHNARGEPVIFKTHKLLSGTLRDLEDENGFNAAVPDSDDVGYKKLLHSAAQYLDQSDVANLRATNSKFKMLNPTQGKAELPAGVPVLTDLVGGQDFNRVLLRHGYHWKDPGAGGVAHGEYTHRIQWYAVISNKSTLGLINTPLQIYKTFGALWSRNTFPGAFDAATSYYLWQMIFDASQTTAKISPLPYSGNYTCPEKLHGDLCGVNGMQTTDPLLYLKMLCNVRRFKRQQLQDRGWSPIDRFQGEPQEGLPTKKAVQVLQQTGQSRQDGSPWAYLVWYMTE